MRGRDQQMEGEDQEDLEGGDQELPGESQEAEEECAVAGTSEETTGMLLE